MLNFREIHAPLERPTALSLHRTMSYQRVDQAPPPSYDEEKWRGS